MEGLRKTKPFCLVIRCLLNNLYKFALISKNNKMKILQILTILPGGMEWVLIALVVLLLFGGKKIPELMKGLGRGISEFKKGKKGEEKEKNE